MQMVLYKGIISADGLNKIGAIFLHLIEFLFAGKLTTSNIFELSRLKNTQEISAAFRICSQKSLKAYRTEAENTSAFKNKEDVLKSTSEFLRLSQPSSMRLS